jgi:PAS domain-containing protein
MKDRVAAQFEEYYPAFDKWFEETAYPFDDGIATHTHDITDGKRAEQSLQESETRFLALLASLDGFCVIADAARRRRRGTKLSFLGQIDGYEDALAAIDQTARQSKL